MKNILLVTMFLLSTLLVRAQVPDFSLKNVLTGNTISLSTYPSCEGVLIIFTGNNCPYDEYYKGRIAKLNQQYKDKVPLLLINSYPDESPESMSAKAKQSGLGVPYLADKDQVVMNSFKATKSPSVFLLKNNNGKFTLVYSGALDDNAQVEADVQHPYLKDAIDIMLANQAIETKEIRPTGCTIKKK